MLFTALNTHQRNYFNDTLKKVSYADLIVMVNNDSLKVTNVREDRKYYFFISTKEEYKFEKKIPVTVVKTYQKNFYLDTTLSITQGISSRNLANNAYAHPNLVIEMPFKPFFTFGFSTGYYYNLGKTPENVDEAMKSHIEKLKGGLGFNGFLACYFSKSIGLGFDYLYFSSNNNASFNLYVNNGFGGSLIASVSIKENILLNHFAPYVSIFADLAKDGKVKYFANLGLSYQTYLDKFSISEQNESTEGSVEGNTFGVLFSNQLDFLLNQNVGLGIRADYSSGLITKVTNTLGGRKEEAKLEKDDRISLSRISISAALRFYVF
ncbi:MAG: hypothetical protein ACKVOU_01820 [Cytophagales bacterium]